MEHPPQLNRLYLYLYIIGIAHPCSWVSFLIPEPSGAAGTSGALMPLKALRTLEALGAPVGLSALSRPAPNNPQNLTPKQSLDNQCFVKNRKIFCKFFQQNACRFEKSVYLCIRNSEITSAQVEEKEEKRKKVLRKFGGYKKRSYLCTHVRL